MSIEMKPLFSMWQKVTWCTLLAAPIVYIAYLFITLPTAGHVDIPWALLLCIALPIVQIVTDFRMLGTAQRQQLARATESPSHRKLYGISCVFISLSYCHIVYSSTHTEAIAPQWVATAIAVFMALIGNYQVALGQPKYLPLTFNTPFMRRYGDLVTRSYRLAGRLLFTGGLLVLLPIWILPSTYALLLVISLILGVYLLAVLLFGWQYGRRWVQLKVVEEGPL